MSDKTTAEPPNIRRLRELIAHYDRRIANEPDPDMRLELATEREGHKITLIRWEMQNGR